jgi:Ca2+-dependent lipid-binding protein
VVLARCGQIRGVVRITFDPLVEAIPCLGAVSVTLLETPHIDLRLSIINNLDILSLPIMTLLLKLGINVSATATAHA